VALAQFDHLELARGWPTIRLSGEMIDCKIRPLAAATHRFHRRPRHHNQCIPYGCQVAGTPRLQCGWSGRAITWCAASTHD
jgi:hypothetical protein